MLQAFADESEGGDVFVLGGYIAPAEAWASFSNEWDRLLKPFGTLRSDGKYHFKMSEMASLESRMERVPVFFKVIEDHVSGWFSVRLRPSDLKKAMARLKVRSGYLDFGPFSNPWFIAFRALVGTISTSPLWHLGNKVDFYFDMRAEKSAILAAWDGYIAAQPPEDRVYFGSHPNFRDDMDFLPLQAADFWAWWVRKWCIEGAPEKIASPDFGEFSFSKQKKYSGIDIFCSEEVLVEYLLSVFRGAYGSDIPIYDAGAASQ